MECPVGYFSGRSDSAGGACLPCPRGYFSDQTAQTSCTRCGSNLTTLQEGSVSQADCVESCSPGSYYSTETTRCHLCPLGQYQEMSGQSTCNSCPPGLSTRTPGETRSSGCQDVCGAGQELWLAGQCRKCPVGTYKQHAQVFCTPCPYGTTSAGEGATSVDMCDLEECKPGNYWNPTSKSCSPCPVGSYQPEKGQHACMNCPSGHTTDREGSVSVTSCVSASVDECGLGLDSCDELSVCRDTAQSYQCVCKFGRHLDGHCMDACEQYCSELTPCSEDGVTDPDGDGAGQDNPDRCRCRIRTCKSQDGQWRNIYGILTVSSISFSTLAMTVIIITSVILAFRKRRACAEKHEIRYYRRSELGPRGVTNTAFVRADHEGHTSEPGCNTTRGPTASNITTMYNTRTPTFNSVNTRTTTAFSDSSSSITSSSMRSKAALVLEKGAQRQHRNKRQNQTRQQKRWKQAEKDHRQSDTRQESGYQTDRDELSLAMPLATVWYPGHLSLDSHGTETPVETSTM
ncbi:hypothetical protein EGW08_019068 [Elysia chlorotica]|uniref:EGF-like domain-containing protein n=1 Tax=Elysia chlorotica TaxID=188477 RepID=A0A3S1BRI3_ELYCH|nr:hypothetical protein EGW08_019068 [Elysia chlorotica]